MSVFHSLSDWILDMLWEGGWRVKTFLREATTDLCLKLVAFMNRYKSRILAERLFQMSQNYNPRPRPEDN